MCASGTHPGGGIMGAPGALCARTHARRTGGLTRRPLRRRRHRRRPERPRRRRAPRRRPARRSWCSSGATRSAGSPARARSTPATACPASSTTTAWSRRASSAALGLERHGLAWREAPPVLLAEEGGRGLLLDRDPARAAGGELRARSPHDAEAYARYRAFLAKLRAARRGGDELAAAAALARRRRRLLGGGEARARALAPRPPRHPRADARGADVRRRLPERAVRDAAPGRRRSRRRR